MIENERNPGCRETRGVSIGTVSRVLNRSGYASEEARAKVEQAVRELNYRPNELARNLLQNRSMTVAMIVPDVQDDALRHERSQD